MKNTVLVVTLNNRSKIFLLFLYQTHYRSLIIVYREGYRGPATPVIKLVIFDIPLRIRNDMKYLL